MRPGTSKTREMRCTGPSGSVRIETELKQLKTQMEESLHWPFGVSED